MPFNKVEWSREYRQKNKEKIRQQDSEYYQKNKELQKEYQREYSKTDAGKRCKKISQWKGYGIITDDWDLTYKYVMEHTNCDICDIVLTRGNCMSSKCLDHDHSITDDYNIRGVLCRACNIRDTSGMENYYISYINDKIN